VGVLLWVGWGQLHRIDLPSVRGLLGQTESGIMLLLLAATAVNLILAGFYDVAAFGPASRPPGPWGRWTVGILSFAWSNFLTLGPLAGPALRLWLYRRLGVDGGHARAALSLVTLSFSLALIFWCAAAALPLPDPFASLGARLALGAPVAALTYLSLRSLSRLRKAPSFVRDWQGSFPALAIVGMLDWLAAWAVFHMALAGLECGVTPEESLRGFFLGLAIGFASFIPGGLGSADAFWLASLGSAPGGRERLAAALVIYRLIYYVLPWAFSSLVLAGYLVRAGRRIAAFLRTLGASYTFLCGAIFLFEAASPALSSRADFLARTVPLALIEVSHAASVVLGFLLLVISRGLARGYQTSQRMGVALFLAGALTAFLKGWDVEEAMVGLAAAAFLVLFRRSFPRKGRLHPSAEFVISTALFAVALFAAVGFGSFPASADFWESLGRFGYLAQSERFARALLILVSLAVVVALYLSQRSRAKDALPGAAEIERAVLEARAHARSTSSLLVATGDKVIFRAERSKADGEDAASPPEGYIAYRTSGRFLIAYSDPVCPRGIERDLLAAFLDHAADNDRDVVLYQISLDFVPVAHDFGFSLFKLGEEGIVDLASFDLQGSKAKRRRRTVSAAEKAGARFEVVEGKALGTLLPDLRRISEAWLAAKQGAEKGFSVGRFDESYLLRFPCALVRDASGGVVAFANVLCGAEGGELSVDLMRFDPGRAEEAKIDHVMEYLFLKLMLHAKEQGFARFNLGMAPLASVGEERRARPHERLANLFSRHGEHWYNYQGLRHFKEKFDPEWRPRYMAYPRPWDWPLAVTSTAVLIAGGWGRFLRPNG